MVHDLSDGGVDLGFGSGRFDELYSGGVME